MTVEQRKIAEGLSNGLNTQKISELTGYSYTNTNAWLSLLKTEFKAKNSAHLIAILIRKKIIK